MAKVLFSGLLILGLHLITTDALQCLSCDHVAEARDCRHLVTCSPHEICYVQRLIGSNLKQYYKLGCTDKNVCLLEQASIFAMGKREISNIYSPVDETRDLQTRKKSARATNGDMVLCLQCCESADGCNKALCGSAPTTNRRCLSCKDVMDPKDCEQLTECSRDQFCYVHKGLNPSIATFEVRHDMGCIGLLQCNALKTVYPRSCVKCCNSTDLCNYAACDGWIPAQAPTGSHNFTPRPTTPMTTTTTIPTTTTPAPKVIIQGPAKGNYTGKVNLACVTIPPAQSYHWKFNGSDTLPSNVVTGQPTNNAGTVAGIGSIEIKNLTDATFGTYSCVASINGHIVEQLHSVGIIEEAPTAHIKMPPVTNSFAMQCISSGYPVPHITWDFFPTSASSHGVPTDVQFNADGTTLFVNKYNPREHDGIWYCKATNSQGNAITNVHVP